MNDLNRTTGVQAKADSANGIHLKGKVIVDPVLALQARNKAVFDAAIRGRMAAQLAMQIGTSDLVRPTLDGYEVDVLVHTEAGWKAALAGARQDFESCKHQILCQRMPDGNVRFVLGGGKIEFTSNLKEVKS